MRKRAGLTGILGILLLVYVLGNSGQKQMVQMRIEGAQICLSLRVNHGTVKIKSWYDEERGFHYFFLPSCVKEQKIYLDMIHSRTAKIDGAPLSEGYFQWEQGAVHSLETVDAVYQIIFMRAENIPSLFIETKSGSMDYIHADKENHETGSLMVIDDKANIQYNGKLMKISGRGNSTWLPFKKSYSIELPDKYPVCGMDPGKKWKLLSLYFEPDKVHSKIILDVGRKAGLEYTPESTWVDLYCGGEYKGLYLLTESVSSNLGTDNEYLMEKSIPAQVTADDVSFGTSQMGYLFKLRKPASPGKEQADNAKAFMQSIENKVIEGNGAYKDHIDFESLSKQFVIDKITLEADAMVMSTYFVKKKGEDRLYAGPLWDYDRSMGERVPDFETPVEVFADGSMAGWYYTFYNDSEFYEAVVSVYKEMLPYWKEVLDGKIDEYTERIKASVDMDNVLMQKYAVRNEINSYTLYESYVKYLKYFLANRLNYLNGVWGIEDIRFEQPSSNGVIHKVSLAGEDGRIMEVMQVLDGDCINELPTLDEAVYYGWCFEGTNKLYNNKIPVYEDMILYTRLNS